MEYQNRSENRNRNNNNVDRRNRFRRRRHRDYYRRNREEKKDYPLCPICEKAISELSSAINHRETAKPAHFDCIMKTIEQTEGINPNEKICYLGKGSFGIVRFQKMGGTIPFIIRKRIQYENLEETPEWRKNLDKLVSREKPKP
jgi:hypothetical protein